MQKLKRNRARCKVCGDVIESLHRHDFKTCTCRSIFVDGGLDYVRRGGYDKDFEDLIEWETIDESERHE